MDTFEYLTVFVSIILGLGMTYLILGVGRILRRKGKYKIYWIHHLQIVSTFLILLNTWWITYSWVGMKSLTFLHYMFLMCTPFLVVLASSLLFPGGNKKRIQDLKEHYYKIYRPYYVLISLTWPLDLVDTLLKGTDRIAELGWIYVFITLVTFLIILSAAFNRKPYWHGLVQLYMIVILVVTKFLYAPTLESFI